MLLLAFSSYAHAGWFVTHCSDAAGETKLEETKMGLTLTTTKFDEAQGQVSQDIWDSSAENYDLLTYQENNKQVIDSSSESDCSEGELMYYESETYVVILDFTFSDGRLFPAGTYQASDDLKKVSVPMICKYEAGGAHSCRK